MKPLASILLVDDDQTTNSLNHLLLSRLGVAEQVYEARDGSQALTQLQAAPCPPLLILLDLSMPIMNGLQFLEAFQRLPAGLRQQTTVLMLTASLHPRDVARAQQLHAQGFISKPLTAAKVNDMLRTYFQRELPIAG